MKKIKIQEVEIGQKLIKIQVSNTNTELRDHVVIVDDEFRKFWSSPHHKGVGTVWGYAFRGYQDRVYISAELFCFPEDIEEGRELVRTRFEELCREQIEDLEKEKEELKESMKMVMK